MSQLVHQLTKIPNNYHETAPLQTVPIETNVELASTKNRQIPIKTLLTIPAGITSTEKNETSGLLMSVLTEANCIQSRSVNQMTKKIRKKETESHLAFPLKKILNKMRKNRYRKRMRSFVKNNIPKSSHLCDLCRNKTGTRHCTQAV